MDRNTAIGFVLLALLFFGYFYFTQKDRTAYEEQKKRVEDSLARLKPVTDSTTAIVAGKAEIDSADNVLPQKAVEQTEELVTVETELAKYTFTSKGGQPRTVELKKFKTAEGQPLIIDDGKYNNLSYEIRSGGNIQQTSDLYFTPGAVETSNDGSKVISFRLNTPNGAIEHKYVIKPEDYMLGFSIKMQNPSSLLPQNKMSFQWQVKADQMEKEIEWETQQSRVSFVERGDYDFEHFVKGKSDKKTLSKPLDWVAVSQQFFVTSFVAKDQFESASLRWESPKDTALHVIGKMTADLAYQAPSGNNVSMPFQLYYGPNDYGILKSYDNKMQNIVSLGSGIFAFVKYINRGFIMPVFDFLAKHIASFGLIIALLTIIIRLLISPLTYQSYLSGAKMKLLKPEIEQLKAKYGEDKQAFGMEQMKLFKSAGVNPLGGCIPAVLQIPIFFALYNFFNSNISLRGQSFWWAKDLSSFDSIYNLPFSIPFYGDHVSLFTILAVVTSLLISLYGMSNMQDTGNPMMKYLPFIFPVVLLGVFNRMPSALTWYYTVSNVITLAIQFVIQTYIIDHKKILAKLQENKKRPVTKSKWQEKIDAMQNSNEKLKQLKAKTEARKK